MRYKERYTLEELYDNLAITTTELSEIAHMTEVTIRRIRYGLPTRRSTANKLLQAFSKAYDRDLSLENVTGFNLEDRRGPLNKSKGIAEKAEKAEKSSVLSQAVQHIGDAEKAEKRVYNRKQDTGLPEGSVFAIDFGRDHNVKRETFRWHIERGIGPGLIHGPDVPEDGTVQVRDYVRSDERVKRTRKDGTPEIERYLTPDQQLAAIQFWKRHDVSFAECNDSACWCHIILQEKN